MQTLCGNVRHGPEVSTSARRWTRSEGSRGGSPQLPAFGSEGQEEWERGGNKVSLGSGDELAILKLRMMCQHIPNRSWQGWIPRQAAKLSTCSRAPSDGRMATQRTTGRKCVRPPVISGERSLVKFASARLGQRAGLEPRRVAAVFVRRLSRPCGLLVSTEFGATNGRIFRSLPAGEPCIASDLEKVKVLQWDLNCSRQKDAEMQAAVSGVQRVARFQGSDGHREQVEPRVPETEKWTPSPKKFTNS